MVHHEGRDLYRQALQWVKEVGQDLKKTLHDPLRVEYKASAADLVTEKDQDVERFFVNKISETYPDHYILGEEGIVSRSDFDPHQEMVWVIDPIDGTTNFVHQKQDFVVSVGIYDHGSPLIGIIYDPIKDECFHALAGQGAYCNEEQLKPLQPCALEEALIGINGLWLTPNSYFDHSRLHPLIQETRGARSIGAAALEMAYVANERLNAYVTLRLSPWDFAAGVVLLKELGAKVTDIHLNEIDPFQKSSVFVAHPQLHHEIAHRYLKQ